MELQANFQEMMELIGTATKTLENHLLVDEKVPEIWDLLTSNSSSSDYNVEPSPQFIEKDIIPLPSALLEQYSHLQCTCFMGLFPEINRAWITMDNQLFLWNYQDGTDFFVYDGLDQIIISAALVVPKPNVFVDDIKYLLVLATPVEIVLLAVCFVGNHISGELSLHPTQLALPSDNVNMLKITGTKDGRIFMCGKDGCLYEIFYQPQDTWFSKKCKKINHSSSILASYLPTWIKFSGEDTLIDCVVDSTRNILYTLSEKSKISVWDLGNGSSTTFICEKSNIANEAEKICPKGQNWEKSMFEIVSISPVSTTESTMTHLIAITKIGIRFFFTTAELDYGHQAWQNSQIGQTRPQNLQLIHVRLPPPSSDSNSPQAFSFNRYKNVHTTYHAGGILILADSSSDKSDTLVGIYRDMATGQAANQGFLANRNNPNQFLENTTTLEIQGKTWVFSEDISDRSLLISQVAGSIPPRFTSNELAVQQSLPPRKFLCLTNTGLHIVWKLRPVDQLYQILLSSNGNESQELEKFVERYGPTQTCAMCLILCCQSPQTILGQADRQSNPNSSLIFSPSQHSINPNAAQYAARIFFGYGGTPFFDQGGAFPRIEQAQQFDMGHPLAGRDFKFSGSHDGFALYFARILRPVWNLPIFQIQKDKSLTCRLSRNQISNIEESLFQLKQFIARNPQFTSPPIVEPLENSFNIQQRLVNLQKLKYEEEARKREQISLYNLHVLLWRCLEATAFISILMDHQLHKIYFGLSDAMKNNITKLKFSSLVSEQEGIVASNDLVNQLIKIHSGENSTVEVIAEVLRDRCPGYFSDSDRLKFKGMELLSKAKKAKGSDVRDLLLESYAIFSKIPKFLQLKTICKDYKSLYFYVGIVDLCLAYAKEIDPDDRAISYFKEGLMDNVYDAGKQLYELRIQAYSEITSIFDDMLKMSTKSLKTELTYEELDRLKKESLQIAISSSDELFHNSLYNWFLKNGLTVELLELRSPFLEKFLQTCIDKKKCLIYCGNIMLAQQLSQLAEEINCPLNLAERIEKLTKANALLSETPAHDNTDNLNELQEKIEVAKVQFKIFNDIGIVKDNNVVEKVRTELNEKLLNISELYNKYAKYYDLKESQLAIFHCSGHNDVVLVQRIWQSIIEQELIDKKIPTVYNKVLSLGQEFYPSDIAFPLTFLCDYLERKNFEIKLSREPQDLGWVVKLITEVGVSFPILFSIYNEFLDSKDMFWQNKDERMHLLNVIFLLLENWIHFTQLNSQEHDFRQFEMRNVSTAIEKYVVDLSPIRDKFAGELLGKFKHMRRMFDNK